MNASANRREQLSELRQQLVDRFNEEELRTLSFDLAVDYESLPAQGKAGKARELIAFLERTGRLPELTAACARARPALSWTVPSAAAPDGARDHRQVLPLLRSARPWVIMVAAMAVAAIAFLLWDRPGRETSTVAPRETATPTWGAAATPTPASPASPTAPPAPTSSPTPGAPLVTTSVTVGEGDICTWDDTGPVLLRSLLDIGINNNSDRDIMLTSVKLVPEWIMAGVYAGELVSTKTYTVTADAWFQTWMDALNPDNGVALQSAGRLKELDGLPWVRPDPIDVKEIPANKYTIKRHSQERFQIEIGISDPRHYVQGTIFVEIEDDAGDIFRKGPLDIYVCVHGDFPPKP